MKAVWDVAAAFRESTPTRERICLNGLWRWQPAGTQSEQVPAGNWGYFKVPGSWPGITDYMQKDSQTLFVHPAWKDVDQRGIVAAWYERELGVPADWAGRRIFIEADYLNSFAAVFVDGVKAGELRFPGGGVDLTGVCRPGASHRLSLLVVSLPLAAVIRSHSDSASVREQQATVARRGLCGDVYLAGMPRGPLVNDVRIDSSVSRRRLTLDVSLGSLDPDRSYQLRAQVAKDGSVVREFGSPAFQAGDLGDGRFAFAEDWVPDQLWDLDTPQNMFELRLSLVDAAGRVLDAGWPQRFGFREFRIDGRDFLLNGKRVFLSAVPLDNAQIGAASATYEAARETLDRLKGFGINYVYTHNYGCEPGAHLGFDAILRAADDTGMLVGFTQPHFSHYDWKAPTAGDDNGYARHAAFYTRAAGNHPSVVMYVMSHNATGYEEDMNPDMIDGVHEARDQWARGNVELALRAEAIVRGLDPRRIVYHHASGNLGVMHNSNFYPNFAPVQELDDWFEHWAAEGVKPAFTCEYGAPFTWDWTMYRGWHKGRREFGSAKVPWEFCLAEWNAQFLGDRAFRISEAEKGNLRWEAQQFRAGGVWHRWDYPNQVGSDRFDERYPVFANYITNNWRAYRGWGVSGISPWEYGHFWKLRDGFSQVREPLPVDWDHLQRPGFSPDYLDDRMLRMDVAFKRGDWVATPAAEALIRNNRPLLAWLAGKPGAFTAKDHNFLGGETVAKQVIVINNSRQPTTCEAAWSLGLPQPVTGRRQVTVEAGGKAAIPLDFELPEELAPGSYDLHLTATFGGGEAHEDRFRIDVLPRPVAPATAGAEARIALFDPAGETAKLLGRSGVRAEAIPADADLAPYEILVVGKAALTVDGPAPDITRVRDGLKVIVFEQTPDVLARRFGFRVTEYGLRQLFPRIPDHPLLAGLRPDNLRDWRGSATLLPPRLDRSLRSEQGPGVEWAGIPVTRVWRCGNRGNVASVLIEKPARGDFLPVLDGGFSLQYSPLIEYREGTGMLLFCQLDVTGRSEGDPAAAAIVRNALSHVADWQPAPRRKAVYAGEAAGRAWLESLGLAVGSIGGRRLAADEVLVAGPGCGRELANEAAGIAEFLQAGGRLLAVGLNQEDLRALLPFPVTVRNGEHIAAFFDAPGAGSLLAGTSPADVHNRDPREIPLVISGEVEIVGDGVLAVAAGANVVFDQMPPWQFDETGQSNLRRTRRRSAFLLGRLLANLGVAGPTPLLDRFNRPPGAAGEEPRWREGLYLDQAEEWDDPYRFFRW